MPRLTDEQIKQGILHDDIDVRFAALHYFSECRSPDTSVMLVVIEALSRFGRDKAFRHIHPISELAQTETTIRWAIEELHRPEVSLDIGASYHHHIGRLLAEADPLLTQPVEQDILAAPGFDEDSRDRLLLRLKLLGWDEPALWRELELICEQGMAAEHIDETRFGEAEDVVEEMARKGVADIDRMMTLLRMTLDDAEGDPRLLLMEPLMVRLAGALRHEPAIPHIFEKLHEDSDVLSEACQTALGRIGSNAVVDALREVYLGKEWSFRLYAGGALERIHGDAAVRLGIELLEKEPDAELKDNLASGLAGQFSTEGNEVVYRYLQIDGDSYSAMSAFVASCALTGQTFPDLPTWTDEVKGRRERPGGWKTLLPADDEGDEGSEDDYYRPAPTLRPIVADKRPGRNDPCPRGSGKKYKKCCLLKETP